MTTWEYLIIALPGFERPTHTPGASAAVQALNDEGSRSWEAVGMTTLTDGTIAVLCKRERAAEHPPGDGDSDEDSREARPATAG